MLLHGFPDTPVSMEPLAVQLASHGCRVHAPYLRGYGPSSLAPDGRYAVLDLAQDIEGLLTKLGVQNCLLVGHDWGAVIAYAVSARNRIPLRGVVGLSVPPVADFLRTGLRSPMQWWQSRYMLYFQASGLAEALVSRKDFRFVETIWRRWSPVWAPPEWALDAVKRSLSHPGALEAALSYYRCARPRINRHYRASFQLMMMPPKHKTICMVGTEDRCIQARCFQRVRYPVYRIPHAGHFLPLEATHLVAKEVLRIL